jgi:pteridine reductase
LVFASDETPRFYFAVEEDAAKGGKLRRAMTALMRALVTGGTGRVGSAIAARLERDGWRVLAAGRADGDVAAVGEARRLVGRAAEELGGLDLLVNAAGEGFEPTQFEDLDEAAWEAAFGATAKGSFFVTQAAAPQLRSTRGCVVMIEDVAAYQPWPSFAAHCAAKAAQAMLTRVLARALAPEVRVCGVAPGPVAVERSQEERRAAETLLGRIGTPEDVAAAVAYLATADFVTGSTIVVDGGRLLQTGRSAKA